MANNDIQLSKVFMEAADPILIEDLAGIVIDINQAAERTYGWTREELIGRPIKTIIPPKRYKQADDLLTRCKRGEQIRNVEGLQRKKSGEVIPVLITLSLLTDRSKEAIAIVTFTKNITDLKQAQEAFRANESRLIEAERMARLGSWYWEMEDNIWHLSEGLCHILGISPDELGNTCKSLLYFVHPEDRERAVKSLREALRGDQPLYDHCRINLVDGSERVILMEAKLTFDEHGKAIRILGTAQDVTEQNRLQTQLLQSQKMDAIASLAGGIAHELNNALVGITGNIELLEMALPNDRNITKYIETMKTSAWRMSHLANKLLAYAKGGKYRPKPLSLSTFVEETLPSIRQVINRSVRLETDLTHGILDTEADAVQMQMVLSAILSNASEAVGDNGHIRIITENVEIDEEFAKKHRGLVPGHYVCLTVEDNGKGMDQITISRIFEPFYTKKFPGRGLDMAAVYGIVKNHDGWISVDSEFCKGTVVRIYLPAIEVEAKGMEE